MDRTNGLQVVLGAGGGTGRAIVDELVRQGRQVRAVSRGAIVGLPAGVEQVRADLYDPADAARAVDGASVVYHAAQPPYTDWAGNFERLNDVRSRVRPPRPERASCSRTTSTCTAPAAHP